MRHWLRRGAARSLPLVVVIGIVGGGLLAIGAGARRTATAPDRYVTAQGVEFDAEVTQERGRPLTETIAGVDGVDAIAGVTFVFGVLVAHGSGVDSEIDGLVFAGDAAAFGGRLVAGRQPDANSPGEFVATRSLLDAADVEIGDQLTLRTLNQDFADGAGFVETPGPEAFGPSTAATLVGVIESAAQLEDPSPLAVFPRRLIDDEQIAIVSTIIAVDLAAGLTLDDLRSALDVLDGSDQLGVASVEPISDEMRTATSTQAVGLTILAGLAVLASVAVFGQLIGRQLRPSGAELGALAAIGYSRRQLLADTAARAAMIVGGGVLLAVTGAFAASGLFPFGFARQLEPSPGPRWDGLVLLGGGLGLVVTLVGWVTAAALRLRPALAGERQGRTIGSLARACPTTPMSVGVRFAFAAGRAERRGWAAGISGIAVLVAALTGTLVFVVSLFRLIDEPARYGKNFDVVADNGAVSLPDGLLDGLLAEPAVEALSAYTSTTARVGNVTVPVEAVDPIRGSLLPVLLSGRQPIAPHDVALGRLTAEQLQVSVGSQLTMVGSGGMAEFEVTGLVIPHGIGGNDVLGEGAVITGGGRELISPESEPNAAVIDVAPDASADALAALIVVLGGDPAEGDVTRLIGVGRPSAIVNIDRVAYVPVVLAGLLGALAAMTVVGVLLGGVRRRPGAFGVLRALGADRSWLRRTQGWQGLATVVGPSIVGIPLGLLAGATVFHAYARNAGAVDRPSLGVVPTGLSCAALLVVGVAAALIAGRATRRASPATLLRSE